MDQIEAPTTNFAGDVPPGSSGFDRLCGETKVAICEMLQARDEMRVLHSLAAARIEFHTIITGLFQETITLEPTDSSIHQLRETLDNPELAQQVRRIIIKSVPTDFNDLGVRLHRFPGRHGDEHAEDWAATIADLHRLPLLDSVVLTFTVLCADERDDPDEEQPVQRICEPPEVRSWILAVVFDGMAAINNRPGRGIRSLTVTNLQNKIHDTVESPAFAAVLSQLRELRVDVVTEVVARFDLLPGQQEDEGEYSDLEMQIKLDFWADFNRFWLTPAQGTLERLAVSCSDPFGVVPRWDVTNLDFPELLHLELEKVTFSYHSQIAWMAAHKKLRTLWLHNCPIAQQWRTRDTYERELDMAALIKYTSQPHTLWDTWVSELRWSDVVQQLCESLPDLREFEMTWGEHEERLTTTRRIIQDSPDLDEMPRYHTFKGTRNKQWSILYSSVSSNSCLPPSQRPMTIQRHMDSSAFDMVQTILRDRLEMDGVDEMARRFVAFIQREREREQASTG